jgi:DNA-binding transcriptional regulator GbsR (MarR family)
MLKPRDQLIENFGMYFEQYGMSRILGRVYGLLMIADEPMLGLDQMAEQLNISKASVSTTVRQLQAFTLIEKVTVPGNRKDYYRVSPDAHVQYLKNSVEGSARFAKLIENAAHLKDLSPAVRQKLERLEHLYEAFNAVVQDFFANYNFEETQRVSKSRKGKS